MEYQNDAIASLDPYTERVKPLSEKRIELLIHIVTSGESTWAYKLDKIENVVHQPTAIIWLEDLEERGYLRSYDGIAPTGVPKNVHDPTLAGALFVYCELYKRRGWRNRITAEVMVGLDPLVKYSSFISACSRSKFWEDIRALEDITENPAYSLMEEFGILAEEIIPIQRGLILIERLENVSACFADIVFNAATSLITYLEHRPERIRFFNSYPAAFDLEFSTRIIKAFIEHAVDMKSLNIDLASSSLSEIKSMCILKDEILPQLCIDSSAEGLIEKLSCEFERCSLLHEGYTATIENLEKYQ